MAINVIILFDPVVNADAILRDFIEYNSLSIENGTYNGNGYVREKLNQTQLENRSKLFKTS